MAFPQYDPRAKNYQGNHNSPTHRKTSFLSSPVTPAPVPPIPVVTKTPVPPTLADEGIQSSVATILTRERNRQGRQSTILSGGQGFEERISKISKILLGR